MPRKQNVSAKERREAKQAAAPIVENERVAREQDVSGLDARVAALEAFRDRAAGFAAAVHNHGAASITQGIFAVERIPAHGNVYHSVNFAAQNYVDSSFAPISHNNGNHSSEYATRSYVDSAFAPTPHDDSHHFGSGI